MVDGLVWALRVLARMGDSKARQQLVLRAALLGQSGIDLLAPEPVHSLDGYDGWPLTGFQVESRNQDRTGLGGGVQPSNKAFEGGLNFKAQVFKVTKLLGWQILEGEPFLR